MSTVRVEIGKTIQAKEYEPLRISIAIEDDVKPNEKVSQAVDRVYELTERKLLEKVREELGVLGRI